VNQRADADWLRLQYVASERRVCGLMGMKDPEVQDTANKIIRAAYEAMTGLKLNCNGN
jgi:hypothetical protein